MKLGEILTRRRLVSEAQLKVALVQQHLRGVRLGTWFVESGILASDQVTLALAEQFGVAPALEADFARSEATLRRRLRAELASELKVIPLFPTSPRRVAVAMANPADRRAFDRLAFTLGATIDPMVASEAAIAHYLDLYYGVARKGKRKGENDRAAKIVLPAPHQLQSARKAAADEEEIRPALRTHRRAPVQAARSSPPVPELAQHGSTPAPQGQELRLAPLRPGDPPRDSAAPVEVMADALCFTPTPLTYLPPFSSDSPPQPSRVAERRSTLTPLVVPVTSAGAQLAVDQIRFATDQQDLSDNLFTFMRVCFGIGAMVAVSGAVARGRFGFSDGRVRPAMETLTFSLSLPSCFRIARSRRALYRGCPPPDGLAVHGPLWAALCCLPPTDVLVAPVIVDSHVTLLLYAQGENGCRMTSAAVERMEQVCEALGSSLLRLAG
jgi:hypothetical protein